MRRTLGLALLAGGTAAALMAASPVIGAGATAARFDASVRSGSALNQPQSGADWPSFLHDSAHSSYNPAATSITTTNLGNLQPVWRWLVPASPNAGSNQLMATPVVSDGVVYVGAEDGYFYALDEATQQVLWSDFLGLVTSTTCPGAQGIVSTATVADDPATGNPTVYVNAPNGYLYALDAATGAVDWQGLVGIPSTTQNNYYAWGSPLVTNGNVYIGISSECDDPLVPAGVIAFNQSTGAQVAEWHSLAKGKPGASVWSSPAVTADGRIIASTGNGYGGSGQPPYDDSIAALDPNTLSVLDSWEVPAAQQIYDGDFGASPTMFTATINGVSTPMVGDCNKNGTYYAFNQDDLAAGPIWQTTITEPYPGGSEECDAAAIWDGTNLIEGGGAPTTINGTSYMGSVQSLNPATGVPVWQTGLPGLIVGSPTEDGAGVVAAPTLQSSGTPGVYLLSAATGAILDFIPTPRSALFGQPVFDQQDLLIGAGTGEGLTAYEITTPGSPITNVSPATIGDSTTDTVQLTGGGFAGSPSVIVSGDGVSPASVKVVSGTDLSVTLVVKYNATLTARSITVVEPGSSPLVTDTCTACLTISAKPAPPTLTALSPNSVAQGAKNVPVVLTGTNFSPGAVVTTHSGMSASGTTYVSATQIDVNLSVKAGTATGSYNMFVTDPDGLEGKCANCLTVTASAAALPAAVRQARLIRDAALVARAASQVLVWLGAGRLTGMTAG